jgi:transcriptional regulator with XRE-family HTH domain
MSVPPSNLSVSDRRALVKLGQNIHRLREQQGMSLDKLAEAIGIEPQKLSGLEVGALEPDYEMLIALARGLGVPSSVVVADL